MQKQMSGKVFEDFSVGDTISMKYRQSLVNSKEPPILIEGIVISRRNRGMGSTFTVVNKFGEHTVERSFPLYSPFIKSLLVLESRHVRRSKLYYLSSLVTQD